MWQTVRKPRFAGTMVLGLILPLVACSESARHRVLSFFFDGVPEPGAVEVEGYSIEDHAIGTRDAASPRRVPVSAHPPYRENRCDACHDRSDGQTYRPVQEGLCASCHADLSGIPAFVHGPVAVNACDMCHHHHASNHPAMLLDPGNDLCLQCHEAEDLTSGPHHENLAATSCLGCHDPHGGDDRLFVRTAHP